MWAGMTTGTGFSASLSTTQNTCDYTVSPPPGALTIAIARKRDVAPSFEVILVQSEELGPVGTPVRRVAPILTTAYSACSNYLYVNTPSLGLRVWG